MEPGGRLISLICELCLLKRWVLRGKRTYRFTRLRFPAFPLTLFALAECREPPTCHQKRNIAVVPPAASSVPGWVAVSFRNVPIHPSMPKRMP